MDTRSIFRKQKDQHVIDLYNMLIFKEKQLFNSLYLNTKYKDIHELVRDSDLRRIEMFINILSDYESIKL